MPQALIPFATVSPVNTSGLAEQINLSYGSMVMIGAPGPVIFTNYGALVVSALAGSRPWSGVVSGQSPGWTP
jgi:Na+/H+ antiporter NhaB